ncbi:hypothetical protein [Nostoc sp.]|uniref:hypothetical protein n=1 Tax=Nostoc sp. TaxID=1180 RepID=UPI002FF64FB4
MVFTVETAQLNNQSILQNFGLVEEIDAQSAEIISGGRNRRRDGWDRDRRRDDWDRDRRRDDWDRSPSTDWERDRRRRDGEYGYSID